VLSGGTWMVWRSLHTLRHLGLPRPTSDPNPPSPFHSLIFLFSFCLSTCTSFLYILVFFVDTICRDISFSQNTLAVTYRWRLVDHVSVTSVRNRALGCGSDIWDSGVVWPRDTHLSQKWHCLLRKVNFNDFFQRFWTAVVLVSFNDILLWIFQRLSVINFSTLH
jgi:hypothetical protein